MVSRIEQPRLSREEIVALDKQYVWHPYTPMGRYIDTTEPLVIDRAEGSFLFDRDGRQFIDGNSSWWVSVLGHNHPRLLAALNRQAQRMTHTSLAGIAHEPAAVLAEQLCAVAPEGLSRVFYSDNGSTAVEVAIKMSLQYWAQVGQSGKRRFLALSDAFHGETLGVASLGGVDVFTKAFGGARMECLHVEPSPEGYEAAFNALEHCLAHEASEIAALVVEPLIQGAGGMKVYDSSWLRAAREWTTRHNVLMVVDEVFTGYGRTGRMWASDHAGISPDIMCIAKGFTSGILPMAATLTSERVFRAFLGADERALFYGHTYCGHPLGAAVASEVLAVFEDEHIVEGTVSKSAAIARAVAGWAEQPGVSKPRALGMMGAVSLGGSGYLDRAGWRVAEAARARGAYIRPLGDTVYIAPPLNIADADLSRLLSIVSESLEVAQGG